MLSCLSFIANLKYFELSKNKEWNKKKLVINKKNSEKLQHVFIFICNN